MAETDRTAQMVKTVQMEVMVKRHTSVLMVIGGLVIRIQAYLLQGKVQARV